MKTLFTFSILFSIALSGAAQCEWDIQPSATVINANGTYDAPFGFFWICPGVTCTFTGGSLMAQMEEGTNVTLNCNGCGAQVKANSTLIINGDGCGANYDPAATIIDNGTNSLTLSCFGPLTFDYSNAPSNGCVVGIDENEVLVTVSVYPNPVKDVLYLSSEDARIQQVSLLDMSGRSMELEFDLMTGVAQVNHLAPGSYFLNIKTDSGDVIKQFLKD